MTENMKVVKSSMQTTSFLLERVDSIFIISHTDGDVYGTRRMITLLFLMVV